MTTRTRGLGRCAPGGAGAALLQKRAAAARRTLAFKRRRPLDRHVSARRDAFRCDTPTLRRWGRGAEDPSSQPPFHRRGGPAAALPSIPESLGTRTSGKRVPRRVLSRAARTVLRFRRAAKSPSASRKGGRLGGGDPDPKAAARSDSGTAGSPGGGRDRPRRTLLCRFNGNGTGSVCGSEWAATRTARAGPQPEGG